MLSPYGKKEWLTIIVLSLLLLGVFLWLTWWIMVALVVLLALAMLSFFRDPERHVPIHKDIMVSPADGKISSIHQVDHFEPFQGPATCVRIFLSVLDVHVNRSPCHARVESITHKPGEYLNALNPRSAEVNEATLIVLTSPVRHQAVAAVRQVAGMIARRIVCAAHVGDTLQRGQRFGLIKFGSTTELYVPNSSRPEVLVRQGQRVYGGLSVLVKLNPPVAKDVSDHAPDQG